MLGDSNLPGERAIVNTAPGGSLHFGGGFSVLDDTRQRDCLLRRATRRLYG